MKLDILAFAAHPDDTVLACSGTLARHIHLGYKVGVVDLTRGELGTRGTPELRAKEAAAATSLLGLSIRENLGYADGFFKDDPEHQLGVIRMIRRFQPDMVLANAITDRHIDHGRAASLVANAFFLSGLRKVATEWEGVPQEPWRPRLLMHYIQDRYIKPDLIVDVTAFWEQKEAAIRCFSSQFYDPNSAEPVTPISTPEFMEFIRGRGLELGRAIGVRYGEGFTMARTPGVTDLLKII